MERTSWDQAEYQLEMLVTAMGGQWAQAGKNGYDTYGSQSRRGVYRYNEQGQASEPLGSRQYRPAELYEHCRFANNALRAMLGEDEYHKRIRGAPERREQRLAEERKATRAWQRRNRKVAAAWNAQRNAEQEERRQAKAKAQADLFDQVREVLEQC